MRVYSSTVATQKLLMGKRVRMQHNYFLKKAVTSLSAGVCKDKKTGAL
jgi:hypothetical protein